MEALTVFISHAQSDVALRHTLTQALAAAGATVWFDSPQERNASQSPTSLELELQEARVYIVLLSTAALASAHVRSEARRYHELHAQDPHRLILPVLVEPIDPDAIWPFLQAYRRIEGPLKAPWQPATLVLGVLSALGLSLPAGTQLAASGYDAAPQGYSSTEHPPTKHPAPRHRLFGRHQR